jgi:hypothetical protein
MRVIVPGHIYELDHLDGFFKTKLCFVKREGPDFPGNVGSHEGPTTQEVIRALIDRTSYVDKQKPAWENVHVIDGLRSALYYLEKRAKRMRGEHISALPYEHVELAPVCSECGHIECTKHVGD